MRGRLERAVPAVGWLRRYQRADLAGDLTAGFTVAVMLIPQGMAYAMLAGLPPVAGLYASAIPPLIYALFGTSRQLAVGPVAIVSLLTLSGISAIAEPGSAEFVGLAALLAVLCGVFQLALGLLRAGFVVNFLSHAVVSGFTSAAAIVIGLSQLAPLLGVGSPTGHSVLALLFQVVRRAGEANPYTVAIGAGSIAALLAARRIAPRFPAALLVVALATLVTGALGLEARGVSVVGSVPSGLPTPRLPALGTGAIAALLSTALTISFVGFLESFAVAKSLATREKYRIDADQELKGLGLANLAAGFFAGFPVTGGFSRSAVNYQAGARTGLATMVTTALILLTLFAFTGFFHSLPHAVLAAIIIVAVAGLVDLRTALHLFRLKPVDAWTLLITFGTTLAIGIEQGILIGIAFSLLVFVWRSAYPHSARLGYLARERVFRNVERYPEVRTFPGTLILRVDAPLYFANMSFLESSLRSALVQHPDLRHLVLDFSAVNDMDAVAVETLEGLIHELQADGVDLRIAAMKGPVRDIIRRAGWQEIFGDRIAHFSLESALHNAGVWHTAEPPSPSPERRWPPEGEPPRG